MANPYSWIEKSLDTIRKASWHRSVLAIDGLPGPVVEVDGRRLVNFASNDYLGLASCPQVMAAAIVAIREYGTGATGSRLLSGHRALHDELERAIARLKQTEDAIVFSSGYLANVGTISAVANHRDLILSDEYNHASLKNGAMLSKATVVVYPHRDVAKLDRLLAQHRSNYRRCLVLTDGVFGMDGDVCPLPKILDLAKSYSSMVMVDEAHSAGVLGARGAGCAEYFDLYAGGRQSFIQMGTLSKSFASLGGYVAGDAALVDFLRNRASSWIYTTGLSPADTAAALAAIAVLEKEPSRVQQLRDNVSYLTKQIDRLLEELPLEKRTYLKRLPTDSAIVCLQVKDSKTVLSLSTQLKERGVLVSAVRPPTVPVSRLRFSVMATHTQAQIEQVAIALRASLRKEMSV